MSIGGEERSSEQSARVGVTWHDRPRDNKGGGMLDEQFFTVRDHHAA